MKDRRQLLSEITEISALDIEEKLLIEHYKIMYPHKLEFLSNNWKWINNPESFDYRYPMVYMHEGEVIGHFNFMPYSAYKNGEILRASWGGDLSVLRPFRGSGIGLEILKSYISRLELFFSYGNDNSMNLVKKRLNWEEYYDTFMLYFSLMPFKNKKIPSVIRKLGNYVLRQGLKQLYKKHSVPHQTITFSEITPENLNNLVVNFDHLKGDTIYPIYSLEHLKWRLLDSPYKDAYKIVHFKTLNLYVVINIYNYEGLKYIDLMRTPENTTKEQLKTIIASLAIWSINNNVSLIRYYTAQKEYKDYLGDYLKLSVQNPRCCYFANEEEVFEDMKKSKWRWEIIDGDFERF